jgi:glycosyltransferase involved in cell wall biosynthesis
VIRAYETGEQWTQYRCHWVETHIDRGAVAKLWKLLTGFLQYLFLLPFAQLVHIHLSAPMSARRKLLFYLPARWLGKKIIVHFHTESVDKRCFRLYRLLFSGADRIVVLSNTCRDFVEHTFQVSGKVRLVYNPCLYISELNSADRTHSILFAGTLCKRKSPNDLIKAFSRIALRFPDWYLTFAGNGEVDEARILAEKLGVDGQSRFLGWVDGEERDKVFREASVFCLPSYEEGFPMAVLDAWGYGIPVVTTPVGGVVDFARDGENILLCAPGDIGSIAACLEKLMGDEALRASLAAGARKLISEAFDVQKINGQIAQLYKELIG